MSTDPVLELLVRDLNVWERRLYSRLLAGVERSFRAAAPQDPVGPGGTGLAEALARHVRGELARAWEEILEGRKRHAEFQRGFLKAGDAARRRDHILRYARDLGSRGRRLRGDRKAFARWFDRDAVVDRALRLLGEREYRAAFLLGRLGSVAALCLEEAQGPAEQETLWRRLDVESAVRPFFGYEGDPRVARAALAGLARALEPLPRPLRERLTTSGTLQYALRCALHRRQDVWVQCAAIDLLEKLSPPSFENLLDRRLGPQATREGESDDLFVRRHLTDLLARRFDGLADPERIAALGAADPSPHVRQGLAAALAAAPPAIARRGLSRLALEDAAHQVRAAAVLEAPRLAERKDPRLKRYSLGLVLQVWRQETHPFVLRASFEASVRAATTLAEEGEGLLARWWPRADRALSRLQAGGPDLAVRRAAGETRERIWCLSRPRQRWLHRELSRTLARLPPEKAVRLPRDLLDGVELETLGRVLSVLAQRGFPLEIQRHLLGTRAIKGPRFRFRIWRLLYELRHPSPDKRQGFPHTRARVFDGELRAPSAVLSELAETRVPGEPLFVAEEGGWRPYLPLVDDVLSLLDRGFCPPPVNIFSSEGITRVEPPRSYLRRQLAWWRLTAAYARYAAMRNWRGPEDGEPRRYVEALRDLGCSVTFHAHGGPGDPDRRGDPEVVKFFGTGAPFVLDQLWERLQSYFVSAYDNTVHGLAVFAIVISALFAGRHLWANLTLARARRALPLVIGGWGTRGKSGTERLKAALFNALGHGLVSKTTGCEAMFLYAPAFGRLRELGLYRPYGKATIWEQRDVVLLARDLGVEVFLWECMGLNPEYVRILQREWMRDDASTITNTYPDHEDLQGPAGIDIPQVMVNFIAPGSTLFTTEEQMCPILEEGARRAGVELRRAGWLEAGLLAPDVLARFPYEEHPHNVALVLALAEEIGVSRNFALKEMADRVVPDVGVLKTFPRARLHGRLLEFANGMSANERHGCLENWRRLGFDRLDRRQDSGTWVVALVNNRADRVARSRVFADILVQDLSADLHVLVGTNLRGLLGYLRESWERFLGRLPAGRGEAAREWLAAFARRSRLPRDEAEIAARLRAMLSGLGAEKHDGEGFAALWSEPALLRERLEAAGFAAAAEGIALHLREEIDALKAYRELVRSLETGATLADRRIRELLWAWFERKTITIDDPHVRGEELAERICAATPPGLLARILGIQNIKGPGLEFVRTWQVSEECEAACGLLETRRPSEVEQGLQRLTAVRDFTILCRERVAAALGALEASPAGRPEHVQADIEVIRTRLEAAKRATEAGSRGGGGTGGWASRAAGWIEQVLDPGDGVRRRRLARRIYRDLAAGRISQERAARELQELHQRQEGGWLIGTLRSPWPLLWNRRWGGKSLKGWKS